MTDIPIRGMTADEVRELVEKLAKVEELIDASIKNYYMPSSLYAARNLMRKSLQSILARTGEK